MWSADISTFKNEDVNYTINKINNGIVISFKPSEKNFRQKDIGDYNLTFQSLSKKVVNKKYIFKTKLEVSDYPYNEHLKHK
ncbi:MAG: hypothetical protein EAZ70_09655 [Runella slithyformis]|nr:MAG: hypothetical protein EAZ70_09655 [Runella slithyformis]TAF44076.1 MAG: hypothetical protein EAZ63_12770 [Runella slithyformis]